MTINLRRVIPAALAVALSCGVAGFGKPAAAAGGVSGPYFVVKLSDGFMWVPCGFEVRVLTEPFGVLEISSTKVATKREDLVTPDIYRAHILAGGADLLQQLGMTADALAGLGTPIVSTLGRVTVTAWPQPYGPYKPKRYLSVLEHGSARVVVITANPGFAVDLAESIDINDRPIDLH